MENFRQLTYVSSASLVSPAAITLTLDSISAVLNTSYPAAIIYKLSSKLAVVEI